jgi:putative spermidine/putrescine transport system ATP-binding protein
VRIFGEPGTFSVRPEKVHLHHRTEATGGDDGCRVSGVVTEVVYLGAATHSVVDVGDGVRITVLQQNRETTVDQVLARRGETVVLTWRREHVVRLGDQQDPDPGEQESTEQQSRELR